MFDRDREWSALVRFARHPGADPSLGLVSGRRRQGKSFLLEALCDERGGFYHAAREEEGAPALRAFGTALGRWTGSPTSLELGSWEQALELTLDIAERPTPVVIDEFPYLISSEPSIPSLLQNALDRRQRGRGRPTRLILCGSALSTMQRLLSGAAPLRGRVALDLLIHPFDFRETAGFWGCGSDPSLAFRLHAIVGGTPAYRTFVRGDAPSSVRDFDAWVRRAVLDPASPLFREAPILLAEEPGISDRALYTSVLSAIASGATRTGEIAARLGRPQTALAHPLRILTELRLIRANEDAFRRRRATYRIAEPIVAFHHLVVAPNLPALERGRAAEVWPRSTKETFSSRVLGPHLEELAREWTRSFASGSTLGGMAQRVASTVVNDEAARTTHEVDVVALPAGDGSALAIGEAKWSSRRLPLDELTRLDHLRELLASGGKADADRTRLLLFSASGFTDPLMQAARTRGDVELIDLERLYAGT